MIPRGYSSMLSTLLSKQALNSLTLNRLQLASPPPLSRFWQRLSPHRPTAMRPTRASITQIIITRSSSISLIGMLVMHTPLSGLLPLFRYIHPIYVLEVHLLVLDDGLRQLEGELIRHPQHPLLPGFVLLAVGNELSQLTHGGDTSSVSFYQFAEREVPRVALVLHVDAGHDLTHLDYRVGVGLLGHDLVGEEMQELSLADLGELLAAVVFGYLEQIGEVNPAVGELATRDDHLAELEETEQHLEQDRGFLGRGAEAVQGEVLGGVGCGEEVSEETALCPQFRLTDPIPHCFEEVNLPFPVSPQRFLDFLELLLSDIEHLLVQVDLVLLHVVGHQDPLQLLLALGILLDLEPIEVDGQTHVDEIFGVVPIES